MKQLILLSGMLLFVACNSIERLVEKGQYDKAIDKALTKLNKKDKIKTSQLKDLEKAFYRMNQEDIAYVKKQASSQHASWSDIYSVLEKIDYRQKFVESNMPIISVDGYVGNFNFVKVGKLEEQSFAQAQKRDLEEIERLKNRNDASLWESIYILYERIDKRQQNVKNRPALVGSDGYRADHNMANVGQVLSDAKINTANYEFDQAMQLLEKARRGDKHAGQDAFYAFEKVENYNTKIAKVLDYKSEARYLGTTRVLVDMENQSNAIIPKAFEQEILSLHVKDLDDTWTKYFIGNPGKMDMDIRATLAINELLVSPEREDVFHYTDSKKVRDGWEYVLDYNGNVKKDTLGNDIKVDKYTEVRAHVVEFRRTKAASVSGKVHFYRYITGEEYSTESIHVEAVFDDVSATYKGDRRALTNQSLHKIKDMPAPFPSNYSLTMEAASILKQELKSKIDRLS